MFYESTHVTKDDVRAMIGADILRLYPGAPLKWSQVATEVNARHLFCKHMRDCKGLGLRRNKRRCCRIRRGGCFRAR